VQTRKGKGDAKPDATIATHSECNRNPLNCEDKVLPRDLVLAITGAALSAASLVMHADTAYDAW
jgi:hypothetical protein